MIDASDRSKVLYDTLALRTARYIDDTVDFKKFADFSTFINTASVPTEDSKEERIREVEEEPEQQVESSQAEEPEQQVASSQAEEPEQQTSNTDAAAEDTIDDMTVDEI